MEGFTSQADQEIYEAFKRGDLRMVENDIGPPSVDEYHVNPPRSRIATHHEVMVWKRMTQEERDNNQGVTSSADDQAEAIVKEGDLPEAVSTEELMRMLKMEPRTFEEALDLVIARCKEVMYSRQRKYGSRNISKHGEVGVAIRSSDKSERIHNAYFYPNGTPRAEPVDIFGDDSLDDAWVDTANYGMIALMLRMGIWGLPMEGSDG